MSDINNNNNNESSNGSGGTDGVAAATPAGGVSNIRYRTITTTSTPTTSSQQQQQQPQDQPSSSSSLTTTSSIHNNNQDDAITTSTISTTTIREGHLLSLMMFTGSPGPATPPGVPRDINPVFLEFSLAAYLAWRDINERRSRILPHLPSLLRGCDFYWTYEARDTANSPRHAINELLEASKPLWELYNNNNDQYDEQDDEVAGTTTEETTTAEIDTEGNAQQVLEDGEDDVTSKTTFVIYNEEEEDKDDESDSNSNNPQESRLTGQSSQQSQSSPQQQQQQHRQQAPFALAGNLFSSITQSMTTLASALEIPQISGTATSMLLDKKSGGDLFARTIPTNAQDAAAVMTYYHKQLKVTRVGCVFINEPFGIGFNKALKDAAAPYNITLVSFPMDRNALEDSMVDLKASRARYIFAIVLEDDWQPVVQAAHTAGLMGIRAPQYSWLVPELAYLSAPTFALDKSTQTDLAQAMHGLGLINLQMQTQYQHKFNRAIQNLVESEDEMDTFIRYHTGRPELFDNWTHPGEAFPFLYHHLVYDSVIALGLAACDTPGLFTGPQLYRSLLKQEFEGVSGRVTFHPQTGTRDAVSTQYRVDNLLLRNESSPGFFQDDVYKFDTAECVWVRGQEVYEVWPFVYSDNTTNPPLDIPAFDEISFYDYHWIPQHLLVLGYCLGGGMIAFSLLSACWTIDGWKSFVVSAAQPVFLLQLCLGVVVMASAIFPLGMQGEESYEPALNKACMSIPWLLFLGFVVALTALMSKTWRVSQIMGGANRGKKTLAVSTRDVLAPLLILLPINVAMLIAWTLVSPYQYVRIPIDNFDEFGRSTESFGTCQCPNNWAWLFAGIMCAANSCGSLFVIIQCYQTRHISLYFSETKYLAMSLASLMECVMVGGPLLFLVKDRPSAFFIFSTVMICIVCLSFLIPIFGFKFANTHATYEDAKRDTEQLERNTEVRNKQGPIASFVRESNLQAAAANNSDSLTQSINLPPGFMEVRRLNKSGNDDDSIGACSYRSGRSQKTTNSNKSTSTRTSLLSQASSRVISAVKRRTSNLPGPASSRIGFGIHGASGGVGGLSRNNGLAARSSIHSDPGLAPVEESRTTYNSTTEHASSKPVSASFSNHVPVSSRQFSTEFPSSRQFSKSNNTKPTLPSSVSFSNINLDSEISEAFTVDEMGDSQLEEEQQGRRSSLPFRKSMPFAARLQRFSVKNAAPPDSVTFTTWNAAELDVSDDFSVEEDDDDVDAQNNGQKGDRRRRKSSVTKPNHISMYDARPATNSEAEAEGMGESFSSLKDISNQSDAAAIDDLMALVDKMNPPQRQQRSSSMRSSVGSSRSRRPSMLNSIVENDEELTDAEGD